MSLHLLTLFEMQTPKAQTFGVTLELKMALKA